MEQAHIVVEDLTGQYWEGALVDAVTANQLACRGVTLLPVIPDMFTMSGVGGFAKRAWGSGWPLDHTTPKHLCPLTLFCDDTNDMGRPLYNKVCWCARLTCDVEHLKAFTVDGKRFYGSVRFTPDGNQMNPHRMGLQQLSAPVDLAKLPAADEAGGWIVGGTCKAQVPCKAHYGFSLHGMGPGLRAVWVAASLSA